MGKEKTHINIVVIGHIDSGKSTTTGHLIYKCGGIDNRTIEKFKKEAAEMRKGSFKYAWIFDKLKLNMSMVSPLISPCGNLRPACIMLPSLMPQDIETSSKTWLQAHPRLTVLSWLLLLVLVSLKPCISENRHTHEHALLAYTLGVKQLIVGVNKMYTCGGFILIFGKSNTVM